MHTLLLRLVSLDNRSRRQTCLHLLILLDERAAPAPVAHAAVGAARALDTEALADLATLHHGVDPAAAGEPGDAAHEQAVCVDGLVRLHGGVAHAL